MTPKRAKVWNDNTIEWTEKFNGDTIKIPSKGYIEMEFYQANAFKGQFSPIRKTPDDQPDPKSFKMIRVEPIMPETDEIEIETVYQCNKCRKGFTTEAGLMKHSEAEHGDQMVTDPEAEREIPKKRGRPPKTTEATVE